MRYYGYYSNFARPRRTEVGRVQILKDAEAEEAAEPGTAERRRLRRSLRRPHAAPFALLALVQRTCTV